MSYPHSRTAIMLIALIATVPFANAQTSNDNVAAQLKAMEERIKALEAEVKSLRAGAAPAAPAPAVLAAETALVPAEAPAPQSVSIGGATGMGKALNPDISFIGDFLGAAGHNNVRGTQSLEFHEGEIGLQAIIDPYARADVFISFGETGVNLEEAFLTFTSLPGGLRARVGKMRAEFGKVNTQHNHVLPWTDRPLMSENLTGGEDGLDDTGFSLTRVLPAPKGIFLEATGQLFRGDSSNVFTAGKRSNVSTVGHLRSYGDLSESTNLEIGASIARGHNDGSPYQVCTDNCGPTPGFVYDPNARYVTTLYGSDISLRWKPLRRAVYHSLLLRNELVLSHRDQLGGQRTAVGTYGMAEYRVNRLWTVGARYDYSERAREAGVDKGFSALLTYWPSEFSQIRAQYRFTNYAPFTSPFDFTTFAKRQLANELRFQFLLVMGAHGAHPF
jgi:hypothetical protein